MVDGIYPWARLADPGPPCARDGHTWWPDGAPYRDALTHLVSYTFRCDRCGLVAIRERSEVEIVLRHYLHEIPWSLPSGVDAWAAWLRDSWPPA